MGLFGGCCRCWSYCCLVWIALTHSPTYSLTQSVSHSLTLIFLLVTWRWLLPSLWQQLALFKKKFRYRKGPRKGKKNKKTSSTDDDQRNHEMPQKGSLEIRESAKFFFHALILLKTNTSSFTLCYGVLEEVYPSKHNRVQPLCTIFYLVLPSFQEKNRVLETLERCGASGNRVDKDVRCERVTYL